MSNGEEKKPGMLVLKRYENEWIDVYHTASGDSFRFRVYKIKSGTRPQVSIAFKDDDRSFGIFRSELVKAN